MRFSYQKPLLVVLLVALRGLGFGDTAQPADVAMSEGIVYATPNGAELALDLARPTQGRGPHPVVLCIHGGGWKDGDRSIYKELIRRLAGSGFAALSVSYRLTSDARNTWPAQLEDVRAALSWIREQAGEFNLDSERIAVLGHSAGGHLSLMLGLLPSAARGEAGLVQAVVNYFGPTDLTQEAAYEPRIFKLAEGLCGGPLAGRVEIYASASPISYVDAGDPPILTFHGTADKIVPVSQARTLHEKLGAVGLVQHMELLDGKKHGWDGEDLKRTDARRLKFLHAYLRGTELPLVASEDFDDGFARWEPSDPEQWQAAGDGRRSYLAMVSETGSYKPKVRSPRNIALLKGVEVTDFVFDVALQYTHRDYAHASLCLFFGYQDPEHFYYVHFGKKADAHANSIFLVNGVPRVSIAKTRTDGTDLGRRWHRVRVARDVESGSIEVFLDDMETPVMTTVDKTLTWGRVGVGSFDDRGNFDTVRLRGVRR